ncbi:MAG: UDP-N-acetylglucosamine diphosphorylase/glucosamine-1-phosphate N-acetyltransferase [Chloroflexi bacterium]|nr:UDP-N-acetylglucosamine diphosphorylase/glucosamine-1-phosphate N-acetyltransferase [Chloroflexota bacterium]
MDDIVGIVLAAGKGTRMKSARPKVLHPLLGRPMAEYALRAVEEATGRKPVVVIGHQADAVRQGLGPDRAEYVVQDPPLGTGDAVRRTRPYLADRARVVLVTNGDMPLLRAETLRALLAAHAAHDGPITLLTVFADDPRGFGRIVRDEQGRVQAIVEEAHATPEQKAIRELNVGVYAFDADWLWPALERLPLSPKGEYYLTDTVALAVAQGREVRAVPLDDPTEAIGVNTRVHLAEAAAVLQQRIVRRWMLAGVTFIDPRRVYVEDTVTLGQDTVVWPDTYLLGDTHIGPECELGPNTYIRDTQVGARCRVFASVLEQAVVEDEVDIGPYGHLRKGAHLARGVHMGNFGEVKNSYLGPGVKMGHFSYIGDATIEADVNIGAGTITCNYDGERKHPTYIGRGAFIGSDTMLVAPLRIGEGARTGAGAVVTKDVPAYTLAVGVPARVIRRLPRPQSSDET